MLHGMSSDVVKRVFPRLNPPLQKLQFMILPTQRKIRYLYNVFAAKAQFSEKWKKKASQ